MTGVQTCALPISGANAFEQSVLLIGDAIVIDMISDGELEKNNRVLMKRHANLE